jgi:hypothetical protein
MNMRGKNPLDKLILKLKIAALKTARAAIIATLTEDEHKVYNAILRKKLIDKGINHV